MRKENPVIVALDVSTRKEAEDLVKELIEHVSIYKVGYQLFISEGVNIIRMIQNRGGKVFLDLKFHDIPSVTSKAVEVAIRENVYMLTIHALGGKRMLEEVVKKVKTLCEGHRKDEPLLLGVTILTSLEEKDLYQMGFSLSLREEIIRLVRICKESNLNGVVCAGGEIALIRERIKDNFLIVTPGVRLKKLSSDDQRRTVTVEEALKYGADYIVIGRAITRSKKPKSEIELILEKIRKMC